MSDDMDRRQVGTIERHGQSIILAIILGVLGWAAYTLRDTHDIVLVHQANLVAVQADMARMRSDIDRATSERYRASDADRDLAAVGRRIESVEQRVARLEGHR